MEIEIDPIASGVQHRAQRQREAGCGRGSRPVSALVRDLGASIPGQSDPRGAKIPKPEWNPPGALPRTTWAWEFSVCELAALGRLSRERDHIFGAHSSGQLLLLSWTLTPDEDHSFGPHPPSSSRPPSWNLAPHTAEKAAQLPVRLALRAHGRGLPVAQPRDHLRRRVVLVAEI